MAVAVVTGAARGVGAATVLALADAGWTVVAVDRATDDPRLPYPMGSAADLAAVSDGRSNVTGVVADACDPRALDEVVRDAESSSRRGGRDHLGGRRDRGRRPALGDAPRAAGGCARRESRHDPRGRRARGSRRCCAARSRAAGRFIAVTSTAATRGLPLLAAYCAAKAAVGGLVRALAVELRGTGVTANAVSPGSTRTPMLDESARIYGLTAAEDFAVQQPIERLVEPAEVASMIVWLAGPGGAAVTGADLPVDGGLAV